MKKLFISLAFIVSAISMTAQSLTDRIGLGVGALYERGLDVTFSVEHETKYHNAWEYFGNGYIKWDKCESDNHICTKSFWNNYRTWGLGIAYKPCISRGLNNYGSLRIGASVSSNTDDVLGGIHVGYEHNYALRNGWRLYWQAKCDVILPNHEDLFRTGIVIGFKIPTKQ